MITRLQTDDKIPPHIYDIAARQGVGIPLKRHRRRIVQIICIGTTIFFFIVAGWLCYTIYASIAFIFLSHTYPNVDNVPSNQLDNYLWMQVMHDDFWANLLQSGSALLGGWANLALFYRAFRTNIYVCTEGLLLLYKKKEEAIRWDEVEEFYTTNGSVTRLVKEDRSSLALPFLLMGGRNQTTSLLISEEIMRCMLPAVLANYKRWNVITFGDLKVTKTGISKPGEQVTWDDLGAVVQEKSRLSVYYLEPEKVRAKDKSSSMTDTGKWHVWRKRGNRQGIPESSWPNLLVFVALVNSILDQRESHDIQEVSDTKSLRSLKETAAIASVRDKRRKRVTVASIVASVVCLLSLLIGLVVYQGVTEQQRADRDAQLIHNFISRMAHKPYYARVPGQNCDHGKAVWLNDDPKNTYSCQQDGLFMTQKDFQYEDAEYFSFMPDYPWAYGHYIPPHYRVQVNATIVLGVSDTCVALEVHIQDFQGRQEFAVCADGSWSYSRCDLHCDTDTQVASGHLSHAKRTYLIAVDVTDTTLTLIVDNQTITSIQDRTYSSTDQLEFAVYGDQNAGEPITARFSNFLYTPYP